MNTGRRLVGALLDRAGIDVRADDYAYDVDERFGTMQADAVPDAWVRTTCGYCSVGCGMLVGIKDGVAVAAKGDPDHPVNGGVIGGKLCPKGYSEHLILRAPGRLTEPLVRAGSAPGPGAGGAQVPTTWDDALDRMVGGFRRLVQEHGPDAVAVLSTGQLVTEEYYALGKLVRLGMGLTNYCGNTTLCMASAASGYKASFGTDGPPGCYEDLEQADVVVLWGANIADNHPLLVPRVLAAKARGAQVIVVDPRATKTAAFATEHVAVRPRSDVTLLNAIIRALIERDLLDHAFIREHTVGFDALAQSVAGFTAGRVVDECGIPAEQLDHLVQAIGTAGACTIAWTMGVNHSVQGTDTVTLINTICAITGNVGRVGASPLSITGQCNAMGTREAGFTASMPGYRSYDDPSARAELASRLGIDESRLPAHRGRAYPDIVDGILDGTIKGLWVIGTNPVVSFPDRARMEQALRQLELLVVQDGFATPTTAMADIVLPSAIWGEKDGTFTNTERRVSRARRLVAPIGSARADFDIVLDVARRWGVADELFTGWSTPEDAFTEWALVSAGRPCDYSGMTYARIEMAGGLQWPCPADTTMPGTTAVGAPRLYTDGVVNTPDGRIRLHPVSPQPMSEPPDDAYPYVLNTGRTVEHWHTRTKTGSVGILEHLSPEAWVELNADDALRLRIGNGALVTVASRRGAVGPVPARVSSTIRSGEVFMPFHFAERCANELTLAEFDPVSREPNYKQCAVSVTAAPPTKPTGRWRRITPSTAP